MLTIHFQGPTEAVEKLKGSQDKIKAKVLAKLPSAHSAQVILRDKPVNASSGAFYGGFIYGEDKEGKKVKCGEVRVKTSSLGKVTPSKEVKKVEKTTRPKEKASEEGLQDIKRIIDEVLRIEEPIVSARDREIGLVKNLGSSLTKSGDVYTYKKQGIYEVYRVSNYSKDKGKIPAAVKNYMQFITVPLRRGGAKIKIELIKWGSSNQLMPDSESYNINVKSTMTYQFKIL